MTEMQQKDLVLSINEYAYVLDETKGHVSCLVGPTKMSLSQSDKLVLFDPISMDRAKQLFTTIPENWYAILKNPVEGNKHPTPGASNGLPENVHVGKKVNITGPDNFALYPGQMAKVIKGHALRSNQYLLARVYEANAANASQGKVFDAEGNEIANTTTNCVNGQILVIKGTEISFYIPPTGIEVVPVDKNHKIFARDAVTLERLEYCILKDENGSKRYVHGPQVVFPAPTETFITSSNGGAIFKAIELSPISGIYVKVIANYKDENDTEHFAGEELFITGNDQMIYYPRPEHAIINYDGKVVHHSIAIPKGEGRYIMNRLTGEIKTVRGPAMYLPDPRTEVVVKRKLTPRQVELWYPGNSEAIAYNEALTEKKVEKATAKALSFSEALNSAYSITASDTYNTTNCSLVTDPFCLDQLESKASISRGTSYTKPRTITLDNKFDGVVSIDVWNGYAVNVISKDGSRQVVCGPQTIILDYDQTLETVTIHGSKTVFLPIADNKMSFYVNAETEERIGASFLLSLNVDFDAAHMDNWFNINDFENVIGSCATQAAKNIVKNQATIEFYDNYKTVLADIKDILNEEFEQNGIIITECSADELEIDSDIADYIENEKTEAVKRSISCSHAAARFEATKYLAEQEIKELEELNRKAEAKLRLQTELKEKQVEANRHVEEMNEAADYAKKQAESAIQEVIDQIAAASLARKDREIQQQIEHTKAAAAIEKEKQESYADMVKEIISAIGPDLAAALTHKANSEMLETVSSAVSPYALAQGESLADVVNKMVRGTSLENVIDGANININ